MVDKNLFVERLKKSMNGMTQKELADKIHVSQPAVSRILNIYSTYMPSGDTLLAIAQELNCSLDWLLGLTYHYDGELKDKEYDYADFLNILTIANAKGYLETKTIFKTDTQINPSNGDPVTFEQTYNTLIIKDKNVYEDLQCAFKNYESDFNVYEKFAKSKQESNKEVATLERISKSVDDAITF